MTTSNNKADYIHNRKVFEIVQTTVSSGAGLTTLYYALDPRKLSSIMVDKNAETATISVTNMFHSSGDLENAGTFWVELDATATDYIAGDSKGLVGVKIVTTPAASDVNINILQYEEGK